MNRPLRDQGPDTLPTKIALAGVAVLLAASCGGSNGPGAGPGGAGGSPTNIDGGSAGTAGSAGAPAGAGGAAGGAAAGTGGSAGTAGSAGAPAGAGGAAGGAAAGAGGTPADGGGLDGTVMVPVARVAILQPTFALAPGSSATLTAQAYDASGAPVAAAIGWRSSDEAIANVAGGVVTAVALGSAQLTATAGAIASAPVTVWVNPPGTTGSLVSSAVAAGTISAADALVYRIYALFGDPRLPGQYLTTEARDGIGEDLLMFDAANQFDALTPEQQADIGPFFVPPAYEPPAPVSPSGAFAESSNTPRPGSCAGWGLSSDWTAQTTAHFKVWQNKTTATWTTASVAAVAATAEEAYATLVASGGFTAPLDDSAFIGCDGGDGKLDIYLGEKVLSAEAVTVPINAAGGGAATPVYIVISSELAPMPASSQEVRDTIAHEFMHAIQFAYPNMGLGTYEWTLDATAVWAEMTVSPTSSNYQGYAYSFMSRIEEPLFFPNHYCDELPGPECDADPKSGLKLYGSYLFFQYATRNVGANTVRSLFENAQHATDSLADLDFVLSGGGGLTAVWPKFVLALWNQDPVPKDASFRGWDGLAETLESSVDVPQLVDVNPNSTPITGKAVTGPTVIAADGMTKVGLRELSASFDHYTFGDHVHSLAFYNGFSQKLSTTPFFINGPPTNTQALAAGSLFVSFDSVTAEQAKGRRLWAMKKINGAWTAPEDWTDHHIVTFCRDKADERIQDLVLLYTNGNFTNARDEEFDAYALDPIGDQKTTLVASPMPCWKYQGVANGELTHTNDTVTNDNFTISSTLDATFVGSPYIAPITLDAGTATVLVSWRFLADPTGYALTEQISGALASCGSGYVLGDSQVFDASFFPMEQFFDSLFPIPGGPGEFAYEGQGGAFQWNANACNGTTKLLPAVSSFDFDLDWKAFQYVDLANLQLASGAAGLAGPIGYPGDYTDPGKLVNTWKLGAMIEPDAPAPGSP